ncbi:hypothetical protein BASA81_008540 [Batrachochytrium salamandrivorans]|nr:hypothetical protein BASA81_008540 [Batrachochytrium salamandrivorans]
MWWWALLLLVLVGGSETAQRFLDWARNNGLQSEMVSWPVSPLWVVCSTNTAQTEFARAGRGVSARQDIFPGQVFLSVPLSLCLSNETYRNTPLEAITRQLDMARGTAYVLLREHSLGNNSFWKPYIDLLPTTFHSLGQWSVKDLRHLQDDDFFLTKQREERRWEWYEYRDLKERLRKELLPRWFTFKTYLWATAVVTTRCFDLNSTLRHTLVPFADLFNHDETSGTRWGLSNAQGQVLMYSYDIIPHQTQVYNNYGGDMSNLRSLTNYGFVKPHNQFNSEELRVNGTEKAGKLFALLNVMKTIQLFARLAKPDGGGVWATCVAVLNAELLTKPTTILEDQTLLLSTASVIGERQRIAITYRLERKLMMAKHRDFCQRALTCLVRKPDSVWLTNLRLYLRLVGMR